MAHPLPPLSLLETRILGVLVEKEHTVPDTYPLSLNALLAGCNQKTSRDPVIDASEADLLEALDTLRSHTLIIESSGSRVTRYGHNVGRVLQVPSQSVALLATLMLRGPQTAAELRANSERLHKFADVSSVEAFLAELAERSAGGLVVELPRAPGARENRWAHLLSGMPEIPASAPGGHTGTPRDPLLADRVARLEDEVATLRKQLARLYEVLGETPDPAA
ncbi:YceH family protein [Niveibacterium sp. 24ML]|uniref:YceH family protein n=1 Tax=Niveibacterium sp. 24ML TaxID=2985512 RepID=UPI00226D5E87|nr:YceH family protein [Niveibacterium sp. 24ML]MCX9157538.1 YceH family protein [Niveibacterium sp. 24ML]